MMTGKPGVYVEVLDGRDTIKITPCYEVKLESVRAGLLEVLALLDAADRPRHLLLHMQDCSRFALLLLMSGLLDRVITHPNTGEWLVVGSDNMVHLLERRVQVVKGCARTACFVNVRLAMNHLDQIAGHPRPDRCAPDAEV